MEVIRKKPTCPGQMKASTRKKINMAQNRSIIAEQAKALGITVIALQKQRFQKFVGTTRLPQKNRLVKVAASRIHASWQ